MTRLSIEREAGMEVLRSVARRGVFATLLTMCLQPVAVSAQDTDAAALWRQMTMMDVQAAYRLLSEDHPGSVPEVGDVSFRQTLDKAHALALERAARTRSIEGYRFTMRGFATMMGDKHIWSDMKVSTGGVSWPGFVIGRRGTDWVVGSVGQAAEGVPPLGAKLISCDGVAADSVAEQRLGGFRAVWSVDAQRTTAAPLLLVDDGNPFLQRPQRCTFESRIGRQDIKLNWQSISSANLNPHFGKAVPVGAPGFGVRQVGSGYWISLQRLSDAALPVIEAVRAQAASLRQAPFVVLDVRGNGGGDSSYGAEIARALTGEAAPEASSTRAGTPECSVVWRATDRVVRSLQGYEERDIRLGRSESAANLTRIRQATQDAQAAGRSFSGPTSCGGGSARSTTREIQFSQRVILLTDHSCFSSCLLVTDLFRKKGALHVGEATDAATRYFEVREDTMPSGLSTFSTLQALSAGSPPQVGPFVPAVAYDGDISDTAAVETWVQALPARRTHRRTSHR